MAICYAKYKRDRRIQENILGSKKSSFNRRQGVPGVHGRKPIRKVSDYCKKLYAVQKFALFYGNLPTKKLKKLVLEAIKSHGNSQDKLIQLLECRLMSFVYRCGWAKTIFHARQLISHYHVLVNGVPTNVGSYRLRVGDIVTLSNDMHDNNDIQASIKDISKKPTYITLNNTFSATLSDLPNLQTVHFPTVMDPGAAITFLRR